MSNASDAPWGGRFSSAMDGAMLAYTQSLAVDARMVAEDIAGSQAHALMLGAVGLLTRDELRVVLSWLEQARIAWEEDTFELRTELEDVHMNVERYLIDGAGPDYGGKLHTARSRNDQVLCDCRLYLRRRLLELEAALHGLARTMLELAGEHLATVMPGYTHSQHAQPISFGYWASAHVSVWCRDLRRLAAAFEVVNQNPLGACALAGTDLPIDRALTAELLGFDSVQEHALDVTSSRDFLAEALAAVALGMVHLSRLAEELVLWSTHEYRLIELDDSFTSGSSIMPQKKNPDCAELTRGKAARVIGSLTALLTTLKSLPMGYSRDLQEDKPPIFDACDQYLGAIVTLTGAVATMRLDRARMRELVEANFAVATQLANWLVAEHGLPFRRAHELTGRLVGALVAEGANLTAHGRVVALLTAEGIAAEAETLADVLDPLAGLARQASFGGPAPAVMQGTMERLDAALAKLEADLRERAEAEEAALLRLRDAVAAALADDPPADEPEPELEPAIDLPPPEHFERPAPEEA